MNQIFVYQSFNTNWENACPSSVTIGVTRVVALTFSVFTKKLALAKAFMTISLRCYVDFGFLTLKK